VLPCNQFHLGEARGGYSSHGGPRTANVCKRSCFDYSRLFVYLSSVFNLLLSHCYLPSEFMKSAIVPLVKNNETGNMTDTNNYRAIASSNAVSTSQKLSITQVITGISLINCWIIIWL